MFDNILTKVAIGIVGVVTAVAGWFGLASKKDIPVLPAPVIQRITENKIVDRVVMEQPVGAAIPIAVARFETSLQSSITDSATSMTLVSGTDTAGTALSGFTCFTIDEGTSVVEDVCGTASSTAITSLTRGISPVTGTSSVASLKKNHRRGASVKITDHPHVALHGRILNGNETIPNQLVYDTSVSSSTMASNLQNVASVAYVNSVSYAGAPNASTIAKGLVEAGTSAEILAGTGTGGTGALLFAPGSLYNATSSATTLIPVTRASGKLHQGFLDLTEAFTFSGVIIHSASTTLATTTIAGLTSISGNFVNTASTTMTSTTTQSGYFNLTGDASFTKDEFISSVSTSTTGSIAIPTGARYAIVAFNGSIPGCTSGFEDEVTVYSTGKTTGSAEHSECNTTVGSDTIRMSATWSGSNIIIGTGSNLTSTSTTTYFYK